MSKEAIGENGAILGSDEYWGSLNRTTILAGVMQGRSETNYYETMREVGSRADSAIGEIYDDLQEHIKSIRVIPSNRRSALAKQVQALYDVCKMTGRFCSHGSDCISILNLSTFYVPSIPFGDERAIQSAIQKIKNCSDFFPSECIDLIRKAADWSISFAAGSDERKSAFLKDVSQGKDRDFLRAVLDTYHGSNDSVDLRGDCGYSIGSREYLDYMERAVFHQGLPTDDYAGILKDALESIAHQLQRDLSRNERDNNYITEDTARELRTVTRELEHCGINPGVPDAAIDKMAWFVGGDSSEIRQLQSKLNQLGVGQRLEEDGVYGEKTKNAIDALISRFSSFLADPDKMRLLDQTVDRIVTVADSITGPGSLVNEIHTIRKQSRRELQRTIWKLGAEYYLRKRGYDVAALLLEHSLENPASDLYFSQAHWVTQKIMQSRGFREAYRKLESEIQKDPNKHAAPGVLQMNFQSTGDTDLYLGIGKCAMNYACVRRLSTIQVNFTIEDSYDFDEIRSVSGDVEHIIRFDLGIGTLANDAGLISQADGVISPYRIFISFSKTIEVEGVYL